MTDGSPSGRLCRDCGRPFEQPHKAGRPRIRCESCRQVINTARKEKPRAPSTGVRVPPNARRKIWELHLDGYSYSYIARVTHFDRATVAAVCKKLQNSSGDQWRAAREEAEAPPPLPGIALGPEARRALEDFGYFRARYFGRVSTPWQEEAAYRVQGLLSTPEKEYAVVNAPPSVGKSTLFTHDVPAWLACRNRRIRGLIGSRTFRQARWYTARLRRTFERVEVLPPDDEEIAAGRALAPESSLVADFGRFRPLTRFTTDVWRAEEFVIAQPGDVLVAEKEASFAAYGFDSGFLGGRFPFVVWDDLVDRKNTRNAEVMAQLTNDYEDLAETRLEPGGLLVLQGQRLGANDLYRHCLDQKAGEPEDWDDDEEPPVDDRPGKYTHVVYRAHYEEDCRGRETHRRDAPYWRPSPTPAGEVLRGLFGYPVPEGGCLLDPRRLTWAELRSIKANRMEKFRVLYQQEDVDPARVLVPKLWVDGGRDPESGEEFPGCWDHDRALTQVPAGLVPPLHSVASADPSASKFWSIQWWAYHPASEFRFLLDLIRESMTAPAFLDWNHAEGVFTGVMEEWWQRSTDLGHPITHWVVEANACQRYLLQYEHVRRWAALRSVAIVPHTTHRNKTDPDFGIQSLAPHWRYGRVRLPGKQYRAGGGASCVAALKLVDEVTRYPDVTYDDCVMAEWMMEFNLSRLFPNRRAGPPRHQRRPSWLSPSRRALARA